MLSRSVSLVSISEDARPASARDGSGAMLVALSESHIPPTFIFCAGFVRPSGKML